MLPRRLEDLTADWTTAALTRGGVMAGTSLDVVVERIGADRGFTGTIARVAWSASDATGTVIVKLPDAAGPGFERCAREVLFYRYLAADVGVRVPGCFDAATDAAAERVVLVLEDVPGRGGDAETGCPASDAATVVDAMAAMHARWWRDDALTRFDWLPRWGRGTAGHPRPHRRAVERFRRRIEPFFAMYGDAVAPGLRDWVETLATDVEDVYEVLATLPPTLIHDDLHLDNLIFAPDGDACVIDWQSASLGPGVRDLTIFLGGSLMGADHDVWPDLVHRYRDALVTRGVPRADLQDMDEHLRLALLRAVAGFISGYGGRNLENMTEREVRLVHKAAGTEGLAGLAMKLHP